MQQFRSGFVKHLGNVNRFCKFSFVEHANESFLDFCKSVNLSPHFTHRQVHCNVEAGYKSAAKYDRPQPSYNADSFKIACSWVRQHFNPYVAGARIVDLDIVVQDLDRSTSAGYPWNMKYHNKGEMFDDGFYDPINYYWDHIGKTNYILPVSCDFSQDYHPIWTSTEKREIREIQKLLDNKIRTFTASPVEFTTASNRMCLDFNNMFYAAEKSCSFVGRSKFNQGWHNLYLRLGKHPTGFEFDASTYDASLFRAALFDQMEMRWEAYPSQYQTTENRRRLFHIYSEIVNSVIVLETENGIADLIMKNTGNPSGSGNTIVDNTMVLYRIFAYCWIRLCPEEIFLQGYNAFNDNVCMALNGDDNTVTVSPLALQFFNAPNIIRTAAELGIVLTTPSEVDRPYMQLSFLSHNAVVINACQQDWILPAPITERVLSSLMYGSECNDIRWHLLRACALHVDSWANVTLRRILSDYIKYILRYHKTELIGEINGIKMQNIFNMIRTDEWCLMLYVGLESGVGTVKQIPHKNNLKMSNYVTWNFNGGDPKDGSVSLDTSYFHQVLDVLRLTDDVLKVAGASALVDTAKKYQWNNFLESEKKNDQEIHDDWPDRPELQSSPNEDNFVSQEELDDFQLPGPIEPGKLGTPIPVFYQRRNKRKRTRRAFVDGLVGIEENPGPKSGKVKNLAKTIKKAEKKIERKIHNVKPPRSTSNHKGPVPNTNGGNRKVFGSNTIVSAAPTAYGTSTTHNQHRIVKFDGKMADCDMTGATSVYGRSFMNVGVGEHKAQTGDETAIFLDGTRVAAGYLPFSFQDLDDKTAALAEVHQFYRVRKLILRYVPLVGTTTQGQWCFNIHDNWNPGSGSYPGTIKAMMTSSVCMTGTPWLPAQLPAYIYNGPRVRSCPSFASSVDPAEYIQLEYEARSLASSASDVEWGRFQAEYWIDFFEPRANSGGIVLTDKLVDNRFFKLFLPSSDFEKSRYFYNAEHYQKVAKRMRELADVLERHPVVQKLRSGKDEEYILSSESPTPEMEENPLTRSLHIPQSTVQALLSKLK